MGPQLNGSTGIQKDPWKSNEKVQEKVTFFRAALSTHESIQPFFHRAHYTDDAS